MSRIPLVKIFKLLVLAVVVAHCHFAHAQVSTPESDNAAANSQNVSELWEKLDRLVEQNTQLEKQNRELMDQIQVLRGTLTQQPGVATRAVETETMSATLSAPAKIQQKETQGTASLPAVQEEPYKWGRYTPNLGYKVADTEYGDLSISIYSYARYLNQLGLDPKYTDASGNVKSVQQRQDFQLNKVQIKFLGWMLDKKFRYFL